MSVWATFFHSPICHLSPGREGERERAKTLEKCYLQMYGPVSNAKKNSWSSPASYISPTCSGNWSGQKLPDRQTNPHLSFRQPKKGVKWEHPFPHLATNRVCSPSLSLLPDSAHELQSNKNQTSAAKVMAHTELSYGNTINPPLLSHLPFGSRESERESPNLGEVLSTNVWSCNQC